MTHQFYALFYVYYIAFMHNIVLNMLPAQQCDSSCSLQYNESLICHQCGVDSVRSMQSMACMRAYVYVFLYARLLQVKVRFWPCRLIQMGWTGGAGGSLLQPPCTPPFSMTQKEKGETKKEHNRMDKQQMRHPPHRHELSHF